MIRSTSTSASTERTIITHQMIHKQSGQGQGPRIKSSRSKQKIRFISVFTVSQPIESTSSSFCHGNAANSSFFAPPLKHIWKYSIQLQTKTPQPTPPKPGNNILNQCPTPFPSCPRVPWVLPTPPLRRSQRNRGRGLHTQRRSTRRCICATSIVPR